MNENEARDVAKRDAERAIALARQEPDEFERNVVSFPWYGEPEPDNPNQTARVLCSDREDLDSRGIYLGPDPHSVFDRISPETAKVHEAGEELWDLWWDTFELALRRANVALLITYFDTDQNDRLYSLYVVDNNRFPEAATEGIHGVEEDGQFMIDELDIQRAYRAEQPSLRERLRKRFSRADR
jgi:hypothetical protein